MYAVEELIKSGTFFTAQLTNNLESKMLLSRFDSKPEDTLNIRVAIPELENRQQRQSSWWKRHSTGPHGKN